ncbi:MAG: lyase family protein [Nanoarchaeota archaeon]
MSQDLVSKLIPEDATARRQALRSVSPDDGKYAMSSSKLTDYISAEAEWRACALVQKVLLETRAEFGQAEQSNVDEVERALEQIDPLNMALLEEKVTKHDQLAVIDEIGRFVSAKTKALLHPGTTSYDILDTARSYLLRKAWTDVVAPKVAESVRKLCDLAESSADIVQAGRTHLQDTSPVTFGLTFSGYAARLADRLVMARRNFDGLRGKVSGIVGTGASVDMVIGSRKSVEFEKVALAKLGLEPDYTATQVVQKERLTDVGHGLVSLMHVLGDFANDMRILYSSAIGEVTSLDAKKRLGGSSADATKNNPIDWENIAGKVAVVESGMRVLYAMVQTDLQRDLRSSVQGRYQPQAMMAETYESFERASKALDQLHINRDVVSVNLQAVRDNPSEAMVAILRGEGWVHPKHGIGHDFVKAMGKEAKSKGRKLLDVSMGDPDFEALHNALSANKRAILAGQIENYLGSAKERMEKNISYARSKVSF